MSKVNRYFDDDVAKELDTDSAIILYNIQFWVELNTRNQNKHTYKEGKYWTYNSARTFTEIFTWLTEKQISTRLNKLVDAGYLKEGNFNKRKGDKTKWFTLTSRSDQMVKSSNQMGSYSDQMVRASDQMVRALPDNKPDINTDNNTYVLKEEEIAKKDLPLESKLPLDIKDDLSIGNPHPPVAFTPLPLKEADEIHELYTNLFNSKQKSKVWYKNFVKWRETYTLEDIKTSITLWRNFGWIWHIDKDRKKPDLELLFRHSNKAGDCDYIGQLLDTHQGKKLLTYEEELDHLENRLADGEIDTGDYEILHRKLLKKYDK